MIKIPAEYKTFRDSKGTAHRYKLRKSCSTKPEAEKSKKYWKSKYYKVRIVKRKSKIYKHKDMYDIYAFALWDH